MIISPSKIAFTFSLFLSLTLYISGYSQHNSGDNYLEKARNYMEKGDFEAANITFRKMLNEVNVLPPEMCYYFAETLYMLKQYENSKNFVEKYLELSNKSHNLYEEAVQLKSLLNGKHEAIRNCQYCNVFGYRLQSCSRCQGKGRVEQTCDYCRGKGIISCQLCDGKGVAISTNQLGEEVYNTCSRCKGKGFHTCPQCHGDKVLKSQCPVCLGSGQEPTDVICDHEPPEGS